ncbi:MAG TPA: hypothetical protein VNZ01_14280 [Solirubrobacteraceae bacterium]|nr:hypothetical protein [Solirubrobacteraceae bacterium]
MSEQPRQHRGCGSRRQRRRERVQLGFPRADRELEVAATRTPAQVRTDLACTQHAPVPVGYRSPDRFTVHGASLLELLERVARLEDGLLGSARRGRQRHGDLGDRKTTQLPHHQRRTLTLGETLEVGDQAGEALSLLDLVLQAAVHRLESFDEAHVRTSPAQQRHGLVVNDPKQPWPHGNVALAGLQRSERPHHRALQCILSVVLVAHD